MRRLPTARLGSLKPQTLHPKSLGERQQPRRAYGDGDADERAVPVPGGAAAVGRRVGALRLPGWRRQLSRLQGCKWGRQGVCQPGYRMCSSSSQRPQDEPHPCAARWIIEQAWDPIHFDMTSRSVGCMSTRAGHAHARRACAPPNGMRATCHLHRSGRPPPLRRWEWRPRAAARAPD